jgi:hypothetical protein
MSALKFIKCITIINCTVLSYHISSIILQYLKIQLNKIVILEMRCFQSMSFLNKIVPFFIIICYQMTNTIRICQLKYHPGAMVYLKKNTKLIQILYFAICLVSVAKINEELILLL